MESAARDIAKERRGGEHVASARVRSADEKREAIAENNRMVRTIAKNVIRP